MEKAVSFPTDSKLFLKLILKLGRLAKEEKIEIRQNYRLVAPKLYGKHARYCHAKQYKRASKTLMRLKVIIGRITRDIERNCINPSEKLKKNLEFANKTLLQEKHSKDKIYSLHAPETNCIAKGKAHKKYEFGCKVSFIVPLKTSFVLGVKAFAKNIYDGHSLEPALAQAQEMIKSKDLIKNVYLDKGYKGAKETLGVKPLIAGTKRNKTRSEIRKLKRRSSIEPIIGHSKNDYHNKRNPLLGELGDELFALSLGIGFNMRKLVSFSHVQFFW